MISQKYKHLFFDLDNTLFDFDACAKEALNECYEKYHLSNWFSDFDGFMTIYSRHNDRLWGEYKHGGVKKDDVKYGRFRLTLSEGQVPDDTIADRMAEDFLLFCSSKNILIKDALEVIAILSKRYSLHIISNGFIEVQYAKMRLTGLEPYFDKITLSEQVKAQKPSPKIFHHALSGANARKTESLMIGDNWDADVMGAKSFGFDQAYYNYHNTPMPGEATYEVTNLKDLLLIL